MRVGVFTDILGICAGVAIGFAAMHALCLSVILGIPATAALFGALCRSISG